MMSYVVPEFDNASVVTNPLKNLRIGKRIMLDKQGRRIVMTFSFHNPETHAMALSFKINNLPRLGNRLAGGSSLCSMTKVHVGDREIQPGKGQAERLLLLPGEDAAELCQNILFGRLKKERISSAQVRIVAGRGLTETLDMELDPQTAGFYSWSNLTAYTVEPISKTLTIPPGKTVTWTCAYELKP